MRMRLRAGWGSLAATITWCALAPAAAPDADRLKTAAEEFDAGRRAFKIRDFENSAAHFENADRDAPSPEALQSAILAWKEAAEPARAATLAAWGLARYPEQGPFSTYAKQIVSSVEKSLTRVEVSCSPDCSVIVDNKVMPFPDSATPVVYVAPGPHTVIAGWSDNRHLAQDINAVAGAVTPLRFEPPPVEPTPAAGLGTAVAIAPAGSSDIASAGGKGLPPYVFFVGVGVTAVLGGVTIWSGLDTLHNPGKDAIATSCAPPNNTTSCPEYQTGLSNQRRTNVLIAASGVAGLATAALGVFFTDWAGKSGQSDRPVASWRPTLGLTDGVTIGAVGSF